MFSDTHLHFKMINESDPEKGASLLNLYSDSHPYFAMDIGTKSDDLCSRSDHVIQTMNLLGPEKKSMVKNYFYFSAGIWPGVDDIKNRFECMRTLEKQIESFRAESIFSEHLVAIGECGIDHHWNPSNPDARNESDFSDQIYKGEKELFMMQLELAKKMDLPVVVHSRDAFSETVECLDECDFHNGIIHCYSYGLDEAKQFLDRGWYLAFGGGATYTKKSKMEAMHELLNYVPEDRFLMETDAPYLAPVPVRGTPNSPLNIHYSYEFVASHRSITVEKLCQMVDGNIKKLFGIDRDFES